VLVSLSAFFGKGKTTIKQSQKPDDKRLSTKSVFTCFEEKSFRKISIFFGVLVRATCSLSRVAGTNTKGRHGETHALDLSSRRPKNPTQHKQQGKNQAKSSWPGFLFFFVIQLMREPSSLEMNTSIKPSRSEVPVVMLWERKSS
jgi:hypothetical protein